MAALKQQLQQKLQQKLSPQQIQLIRLLELTEIEFEERVQQELVDNPALEEGREGVSLTCHDYLIGYYERNGFVNEGRSASNYAGEVWYDLVWEVPSSK